jgi:excisionase family DNA binding protein
MSSTQRLHLEPLLLSFEETCKVLRVSRSTGERLIRRPGSSFPRPLRIGARRFHRPEDVRAWLAAKADEAA